MKELITKERLDRDLYWTRAWSIIEGCSPVSQGCLHCWAADQASMRQCQENKKMKKRYQGLTIKNYKFQNTNYKQTTNPKLQIPNKAVPSGQMLNAYGAKIPEFNGNIRLMEKDLDIPMDIKKPNIFLVLNDLFHEKVPKPFIDLTFNTMAFCQDHVFIILTKRVLRMKEYLSSLEWENGDSWAESHPSNIIIGTSVEDQQTADERLPVLLSIPAACRVVSFEPLLEKIDISFYMGDDGENTTKKFMKKNGWGYCICGGFIDPTHHHDCNNSGPGIHWAIIGHETGKYRRHGNKEHIALLINQIHCTPIFVKAMDIDGKLIKDLNEFPPYYRRREFPSMEFLKRNDAF